jgi:MFS family permease
MRRPWILSGLVVGAGATLGMALAPNVALLTIAGVLAQCAFNAPFAALIGVLADQVPPQQRGVASGIVGATLPVALPVGTFLVQWVAPNQLAMFMVPVAVGAAAMLPFTLTLGDRHLPRAAKTPFSWREFLGSFYLSPRRAPAFALAWWGRFLFVLAYAFLTTYQAYYLIHDLGAPAADVPDLIFRSAVVLSSLTLVSSLVGGKVSDVTGRRKVFVMGAAVVYGAGLLAIAAAGGFTAFLVGIAVAGFGFGLYTAVDLALFIDVLPDSRTAAKDLGVANIAAAMPVSLAPAVAPLVLALGGGSYTVLYGVAAVCAVLSAAFIAPIHGVR